MLLLVNIGLGSSLKNPSHVYVELKQGDTSYLIVHDIKSLEILRENLLRIFLCFQSSILKCSISRKTLLRTTYSFSFFFYL